MSRLFQAIEINGMQLRNRFVRSATWEGMAAEDGTITPRLTELMADLAAGGVGMIITSHAYVSPEGQAGPWQLGVYKDQQVEALRKTTQAVHRHNGCIVLQMAHAGLMANTELTGRSALAPSAVSGFTDSPVKEMTIEEIRTIVAAFGEAARRAKQAGFDGVQIHSAHGYLLNQFLSPAFNNRIDRYGGSVQNRARALIEVLEEVRGTVGRDYPILVKMNSQDFIDGGLTPEDARRAAVMLEDKGIDALEISGGTRHSGDNVASRKGITSKDKEAYFKEAGLFFKKRLRVPVILVGGIRSFDLAEKLVDEGYADLISMSRPFIREPHLIKRWESGDRRKAACLSDNQCRGPILKGEGIYCVVEKKESLTG
jgi:2,4-dienoyl-CoA reductase-like NADH-dependent reductase (Old Yellow Enzyme family)